MLVTGVPENMRIDMSGNRQAVSIVDSDLYNIAERVKEIDPSLVIVFHEDHPEPFTVMEHCADGVTRFVKRYKVLDQRVLDDLRYMLSVPFDERLKIVERQIDRDNASLEAIDDETLDWLASEMRRDLVKTGFSDPIGFTSYPLKKPRG